MKKLLTDSQIDDVHGQIQDLPEYAGARSILVNSDPNLAKIADRMRKDGKQIYELSDRTVYRPDGKPDSFRSISSRSYFDIVMTGCVSHGRTRAEIGRACINRRIEGASHPRFRGQLRSCIVAIGTENRARHLPFGRSILVDHVIVPGGGTRCAQGGGNNTQN
ncbi:MAG TPA: hypothetical protein DCZ94_20085 [Lentisphaeria bacterium]|nr:MAG: hypothetical protein A2X48_14730 [Lentisphaerae bacterium GWF2_49_21]HBC89246.1 hypothetical protein [Lentisphaeria bacterium]